MILEIHILLEVAPSITVHHGVVEQTNLSTFHRHLVEEKTMEGYRDLANS